MLLVVEEGMYPFFGQWAIWWIVDFVAPWSLPLFVDGFFCRWVIFLARFHIAPFSDFLDSRFLHISFLFGLALNPVTWYFFFFPTRFVRFVFFAGSFCILCDFGWVSGLQRVEGVAFLRVFSGRT